MYFLAACTIYTFQTYPISSKAILILQGGSNMTGTYAACLHRNQSRSYFNHLVPSHLSAWLRSGLTSSGFSKKTFLQPLLSAIRSVRSDHLILLDLLTEHYSVRSTDHETNYVILCSPRVPHTSSAQISSSEPNSQKPLTCVLPAI